MTERDRSEVPVWSSIFARRIAAIAVVDLAIGVGFCALIASYFVVSSKMDWIGRLHYPPLGLIMMVLSCAIGLVAVRYTQLNRKREFDGERPPRYVGWQLRSIAIVVCALLFLRWLIPADFDLLALPRIEWFQNWPEGSQWILVFLGFVIPTVWAGAWVHLIRKANRSITALVVGGFTWFMLRLSFGAATDLLGRVSLYQSTDANLTWEYFPGRIFKEPNDILSMTRSILRILWENGAVPLTFIVLFSTLYVLQYHMIRAIRMYVRSYRDTRGGILWISD
jgi:hypothetical protein